MERRNRQDDIDWSRLFALGFLYLLCAGFLFGAISCFVTGNDWGVLCFAVLIALAVSFTRL